jgi:peptidoglycan hydrolase-like protein with peptidoglycan-binding domain
MTWVFIDGQRVASAVADSFNALNAEFTRVFGVSLVVTSGTRTAQEQIDIFTSRYVTARYVQGRQVYDTRWWNGVLWYRVSSAGTVAVPGTSNHEENGPIGPRALDIRDTGADAGIMTHGSARANWYHANSERWNFNSAGDAFREEWHKEWTGGDPHGGTPAGNANTKAQQAWLNLARGENLVEDGVAGPLTVAAVQRYQEFLRGYGYTGAIDGDWGPATQVAHNLYAAEWNTAHNPAAPAYPLADGQYFGPEAGGDQSISGWHSHNFDLKVWQQRMKDRGWTITVDGLYGPIGATTPQGETATVAAAFQRDKGLTVDSLIGKQTWDAAWTAPVTPPPIVPPVDPPTPPILSNNPRNLPTYTPVYPGASFGLVSPLGDGLRGEKGTERVPVPKIIDMAIEHHTGTTLDQLDWFSYKNSRSSCPTWFIRPDGTVFEMIRPEFKPAVTGPEFNWRSVAWEIQATNTVTWEGTPEQFEAVCQILAWVASYNGVSLDTIPVDFALDREHFKNHRECVSTECPGDWWASRMDQQVERAKVIYAEKYEPPVPPIDPPVPDYYKVPRALGDQIRHLTLEAFPE